MADPALPGPPPSDADLPGAASTPLEGGEPAVASAVASAPDLPPRPRPALRKAGALGLELLVVFAGVYAAFLLGRYQESQRDDDRRQAIYRALLTDVERTAAQVEAHRAMLHDVWIEPIAEPYERGEQPPIYDLWLPTHPLSGVWGSVLESGVDLLDPAFIGDVEAQRSAVQFMLDQANVTIRRSNDQITPALGRGDFYGPDGRLRPQYQWYTRFLRYLEDNAERAAGATDSLHAEIERRLTDG